MGKVGQVAGEEVDAAVTGMAGVDLQRERTGLVSPISDSPTHA